MRQSLFFFALPIVVFLMVASVLIPTALAQTTNAFTEEVPFTNMADALLGVNMPPLSANCPPPVIGLHCVYYAGDFNPKPPKYPNALINGIFHDGANVIDGQVWVPIPIQTQIVVKGLLVNELFASAPPATAIGHWEIRRGMAPGVGGTTLCAGTETATLNGTTGRSFTVGATTYTEYNYQILISNPANFCTLAVPVNQDNIVPPNGQCPPHCYASAGTESSAANAAEAPLSPTFGYLSDVTNPQPHHRGLPNIYDQSLFNSTFYNRVYVPASPECQAPLPGPPKEAVTSTPAPFGCRMFSIGIIGTGK